MIDLGKRSKGLLLYIILILAGCTTLPSLYIDQGFKRSSLKRIGILGFKGPNGEYLTDIFTVELLKRVGKDYEIVGRNVLLGTINREQIDKGDIKRLGECLLLDGIIVGSIGEYGYLKEGQGRIYLGWAWDDIEKKGLVLENDGFSELPAVALSVQLLDVESGKILVSASYSRRLSRTYSVGRLAEEMVGHLADSFKKALVETR